ncbi:MAG: NADH:ubiquinone reductase (Na(+)-transporting) subunit B [Bacteroidetes bacterium GWF2_42_66]|nr:MAG: NADH:ubiquinone reductase (Na(+)-transporting) subunit B [Bacteroidetes bacterium GWA2_42_15]OFX99963.1 MAG: NADH:ubiquinone reductase (Na(+)-transporting) subunit B [Bacteroidetes bacterium GWE2_42_39]OFY40148.1 MAG: NADH:ubiquinone reductase (Na(+)-transporting) subunit B [Bacteroidetes bacterium GWF2_42_66]HBL73976.1 NADH:ubiquinone reductase (Na(+)-transporting) subunit B [Prolixibacteraceae bacterium]HCR89213.1 NADH:ubiquinone reductase (Na(+)-transporting) subunit B [Prolixibacter
MKSLRKYIDKKKPLFQKGGKYAKFGSTFGAIETFLFTPNHTSKSGVHIHDAIDLKRTMSVVIIALLPALLFGCWNIGYQNGLAFGIERGLFENFLFGFLKLLPIIIVSYGVGLGIEFISAQIRGHEVNEGFLVSGILIPLILPVNIPLWMVALATAFAVIFGKEIFGGTGYNIMNVALIARAFLFFAYPSQMAGDHVWIYELNSKTPVDGFSGATPLAQMAQGASDKMASFHDMFFGLIPGSIGETSTLAILIGAAILIFTGIGSWKIMLSTIIGVLAIGGLCNVLAINEYMALPPYYHLVMGGFAFGAVFMATDPVTAPHTDKGKWIYGFMIGAFIVLIRVFNPAYPEGMMLAILLMNVWAPLIDYFVVEGHIKRRLKRFKIKGNA